LIACLIPGLSTCYCVIELPQPHFSLAIFIAFQYITSDKLSGFVTELTGKPV